jgi:hypothetical protein
MGPVVFGQRPATREELLVAFDRASAGEDVPLAYKFLLRAPNEEPRQSVIDSCSATEVTITEFLRRSWELSEVPQKTVESGLKTTGVVELFSFSSSREVDRTCQRIRSWTS